MNNGLFNNTFLLTSDISSIFSYSLFLSNNHLINSIKILNKDDKSYDDLRIKISIENNLIKFKDIHISLINSNETIEIDDFDMVVDVDKLKKIEEITSLTLTIEVFDKFSSLFGYSYKVVNVYPINLFSQDVLPYESLVSFINPNDKYIKHLVCKSKKELLKISDQKDFTGYLSNDINEVIKQIESIYYALYKLDLNYSNSATFLKNERIRFPKEIVKSKKVTSLELSLLFLSSLEYIGLNSVLILMKNHSFIGVFLDNESLPTSLSDNQNLIYTYSLKSISKMMVLEPALITLKRDFNDSNEYALKELKENKDTFLALDIHRSRLNRYLPLSIDEESKDEEIDIEVNKMPDINVNEINQDIQKESVSKDKFYIWKKKLLDLSLQNKLINMKIGSNNIQLLTHDIYRLSDYLYSNDDDLLLIDNGNFKDLSSVKKELIDLDNEILIDIENDNYSQKRLEVLLDSKEFNSSIPTLYRKSKSDLEESGSNTLYIAVGVLEYKTSEVSKKSNYAPIILYPVELIKRNGKSYSLRRRDQEPLLNTTLLAYLKDEFNIDIDFLNELPLKNNGESVDLNKVFNTIRKNVIDEGFKIQEAAFLGRFSFNKFIMWDELNNRKDILLQNPLVKSFVNGYKDESLMSENTDINIDKDISIKNYCIPLSSDSSQIKAVIDSSNKKSYVLIGPPGTGKSQTIANIIVNSLFEGKRVLFCSEKKAALDVVYSRLKTLRVDPFCLELHSNKQDKKEVLKTFEKVLEIGEISQSEDFSKISDTYDLINEELTDLVEKIHYPHNYYLSLYDALVNYSKYKEVTGEIKLSDDLISNFNNAKYETIASLFMKAKNFSPVFNKFKEDFPFKVVLLDTYSKEIKESLSETLFDTIKKLENFDSISRKLNKSLKIDSLSDSTINNLYSLFDYLESNPIYFDLLLLTNSNDQINKVINLIKYQKEVLEKEKKLEQEFNIKVIDSNIEDLRFRYEQKESFFFIKKWNETRKILKELRSYAISPKSISKKNLLEKINYLIDLKKEHLRMKKNSLIIESIIKEEYEDKDLDIILNKLNNTLEVNKYLKEIETQNLDSFIIAKYIKEFSNVGESRKMISDYKTLYKDLNKLLNTLISKYKFTLSNIDKNNYLMNLLKSLRGVYNYIDLINEWSNLINIFKELESIGVKGIYESYLETRLNFEEEFKVFNKCLYKTIVDKLIKENKLDSFIGLNIDTLIEEFRKVDNKYKEEVIKEVVSRLSKNVPSSYSSNVSSSEVGMIKKAIKNNGRGLTLRRLFSDAKETILRLTPCVLVSPLSCVKYLDPSKYHFDIVIFDEASQLNLSESISVIGRADSFVIAGDDKQLPPTSFFDKQINDEGEDLELLDLESLLDDAMSLSFPVNRLLFHYRSKDESLIAFSNNKFYDNTMYTFPSPNDLNSKIKFNKVNGIYDSGKSATNKEEANELINYLVERIKNNPENLTFGIITFSVRQMELIQDLLDERMEKDSTLYDKVKALKEEIFVKNLENVQGDESDIILLSICYGKNKNGRFLHNFGPINNTGGYRRLNVAITRSRAEMIIFSSISYSDIDLNKTNSEGVKYLKSFLEYAENGMKALVSQVNSSSLIKNGIEYYIAKDLKERGYESKLHLGDSKFKIDIGILNPITKDSYILGIIIDSYSYSNQLSSKDRNIIEFNVLKSKGWNILMIWALDYYDSPKKVIDKIVEKVEESLKNSKKEVIESPKFDEINFVKEERKVVSHQKPYTFRNVKKPYTENQLLDSRNRQAIFNIIKEIIEVESPIAKSTLMKRVFETFQVARKNKMNTEVVENLINKIQNYISYSYGLPFYFKDSESKNNLNFYRTLGDRKIEEIPKEEILVAIKDVIINEISIEENALKKEVSKLFGFKVKTKKIDEAINEALEYGIKDKKVIVRKENGYLEIKG